MPDIDHLRQLVAFADKGYIVRYGQGTAHVSTGSVPNDATVGDRI